MRLSPIFYALTSLIGAAFAASRTSPPAGAVVVRAGTTTAGEFSTIQAAINSLPNDTSTQTIFIFPGTYSESILITRTAPLTVRDSATIFFLKSEEVSRRYLVTRRPL